MISERFERFEVAVADKAEENCLLSCLSVLVAEVFRNLPDSLLKVFEVFRRAMEVWVITGVANLHDLLHLNIDPLIWVDNSLVALRLQGHFLLQCEALLRSVFKLFK